MIIANKYRRQYIRRRCQLMGVPYSRKTWFVRRASLLERIQEENASCRL